MNRIRESLLEIFRDPGFNDLCKATQDNVIESINRIEQIMPLIGASLAQLQQINEIRAKAQQSQWLGGLSDGYWLSKESDRWDSAVNSTDTPGERPPKTYDT